MAMWWNSLSAVTALLLASTVQGTSFFFSSPYTINRREVSDKCKFSVKTNIWTSCGSLIDSYNVTLPDFYYMNPNVEADCSQFHPGETYCLRFRSSYPVSENGKCGHDMNTTCIGSKFGDCCGRDGQCGSDDEHCAIGYCQDGYCPGLEYSTDGKCGKQNSGLYCGGGFGDCCSNNGTCGSTNAECGAGNCQSGKCRGSSSSSISSSTTGTSSSSSSIGSSNATSSSTPTPRPSPYSPSPDGTCGYQNKYVCNGTDVYYGYCCSAAGYCGTKQWHCDSLQGCQSEYGLCDETVVETTSVSASSTPTAN